MTLPSRETSCWDDKTEKRTKHLFAPTEYFFFLVDIFCDVAEVSGALKSLLGNRQSGILYPGRVRHVLWISPKKQNSDLVFFVFFYGSL